jgi:hypothetical protein
MSALAAILDEDEIARHACERDIALTFRVSASPDVLSKLGVQPPSEGVMHALLYILGALNWAGERWISYSRSHTWYSGRQMAYGRYFTYAFVVRAVDLLHAHGLIEHHRAAPGTQSKRQSTMRATPALLEALQNPAAAYHREPTPLIIIRDADGDQIKVPNTRDIPPMSRKLASLREAEDSIRLKLGNLPGVTQTAHHTSVTFLSKRKTNPDGSPKEVTIHIPTQALETPALARVFSRSTTSCNGRRHVDGGGYQSPPSEFRQQLTMNGDPVGCADFNAMHIRLLYAQAAMQLDGDPYSDIDGVTREQAKLALLVAINAPTKHSAVGAIREHTGLTREQAIRAFEAVCERHAPIARHFASDAGIRLMRLESDILIDAALDCARQGVPVLGVHDELIAPEADIEQVAEAMRRATFDRLGLEIPVRTKSPKSKQARNQGRKEGKGAGGRGERLPSTM